MQTVTNTVSLEEVQKKKIQSFLEFTGTTDKDAARATLTAVGWDVEEAVLQHTMKVSEESDEAPDSDCDDMDIGELDLEYNDSDFDEEPSSSSSSPVSAKFFPKEVTDIPAALSQFVSEFSKRYPTSTTPPFFVENLKKALDLSKELGRPLLFFLTNEGSISTNIFCTSILCNHNVLPLIRSQFVLYPWDVTEHANLEKFLEELENNGMRHTASFVEQIAHPSQTENFPILLPITKASNFDIPTFIQSSDSSDSVVAKLYGAAEEYRSKNRNSEAIKREQEERVEIRRLQEEEYQKSLAADLAKIEKMKQEEAEKKLEEEKRQKEIEEEERMKAEEHARQKEMAKTLPTEPAATEPSVMHVKFRLPGGKHVMRRFRQSESIQILLHFLDSEGYPSDKYKYFNSDFPKKNVMEKFAAESSFVEAKWPVREQIFVEEI